MNAFPLQLEELGASPILDAAGRPQLTAAAASAFQSGQGSSPDYEAASTSHRMGMWGMSGSGPNTALSGPINTLRSRCRTLVRNNGLVAGGVDSLVSNIVGTDISPRWELKDDDLKEQIQELWNDSQEELDSTGVYDFYGMLELVARSLPDAGECLARFRPRPASAGLLVPLQIQLLEADHLDAAFDGQAENGNPIRMGIEWYKDNPSERAAYHLFREHPGERYAYASTYASERIRVPASEVLHIFRPLRIGQARGCPWLTPVLTKLREIDQLDDAVLVRKKIANLFAMFTKKADPIVAGMSGTIPGQFAKSTTTSKAVVPLEPGISVRLKDGEDVTFANPPDVGDNYKDYIKQQLRMVAKGMGIMYEQLSGDLEGVTFSSIRAGVNEFRRLCEMLQVRILVHQFCRPVVRRWLDTAVLSGAIVIPDYTDSKRKYWRVKWHPDGWNYVDPVKDRIAEQMDIRNGIESRVAVVARRGRDVETVDKEQAADLARADRLGLVHDTDSRKTTKSGLMQAAETQSLMDSK